MPLELLCADSMPWYRHGIVPHRWRCAQSVKGAIGTAGLMRSEPGQASWLQRMRGTAYVAPHELVKAWREDFESSSLRHTPASFTALVQVPLLKQPLLLLQSGIA